MWLSLFCMLLILGIAFFQSIHGLFSSLIFCVLAILSAAFAFAMYEWVAYSFLLSFLPDFALPIALVLCFAIPLTVGRLALDHFIRRAGLLPQLADKIGGALFGVITALLLVGVLATGVQMLPFRGGPLGFTRFDPTGEGADEEHERNLWLKPDRFAVRFASILSNGVFSGRRSFREDHPDLLMEIGWAQTVPAEVRHVAGPGALAVGSLTMTEDYVYTKVYEGGEVSEYRANEAKPGHVFWLVSFTPNAEAEDSDNRHRFTLPQIRLVGRDRNGRPEQHIPVAVRDSEDEDAVKVHVRDFQRGSRTEPVVFKLWEPGDDGRIEVTFEVMQGFEPEYLFYKTGARVPVIPRAAARTSDTDRGDDDESGEERPNTRGAAEGTSEERREEPAGRSSSRSGRRRRSASAAGGSEQVSGGDRVSGARVRPGQSFFGAEFPLALSNYTTATPDIDVAAGALRKGHMIASPDDQGEGATRPPVTRFEVPADKRLLQLSVQDLRAHSTLGGALSFAVKTVHNYLITDELGNKYEMVGQYAIASVGGRQVIEVQYRPDQIGSMGRGLWQFERIKERHLEKRDTTLVYLYLINQGRRVTSFDTGRGGGADLRSANLVAE